MGHGLLDDDGGEAADAEVRDVASHLIRLGLFTATRAARDAAAYVVTIVACCGGA